ncbi:MAG: FtsX-like permease family protein, partial [Puniceicoccales bacterium]|nr:FtsX-like permease family protein [Puniceicoccales bacterium]
FGVAFFILTQAQTSGFEHLFIQTILGTDGAIRVSDRMQKTSSSHRFIEGIDYPSPLKGAILAFPEVTGVAEVLRGSAKLDGGRKAAQDAQAFGVNLREFRKVSHLDGQVIFGSLADFEKTPQGILVGSELAGENRANVRPGDIVTLIAGNNAQRFTVCGIFETGVGDIDKVRVITHIAAARSLLSRPFGATYLQVSIKDPEVAPGLSLRLSALLKHYASSWQHREKTWLLVFSALRVSAAVTVSTIILVSALGMFNTLAMLVIEKTREIAILRSFGFSKSDVTRIFLWLGFVVILAGSTLGCVMGALFTFAAEHIPMRLRGIFSTEHFIVKWDADHYLAAIVSAIVVVTIASYFPARRAARIEPGDIIRGAS